MSGAIIESIGIAAPGINDWQHARALLRGELEYTRTALSAFAPTLLPANETRRATATVRIAFRVAEEAMRNCVVDAAGVATVFASSDADMMVSHRICSALAQPQRLVSPTDFHNSVHNAPSGYWHIGARSRLPSSAIAAYDFSFAAGLIETITQVQIEKRATLLVCYDVPAPEPLLESRPLQAAFAVALLIAPEKSARSLCSVKIDSLANMTNDSTLETTAWEALRIANPAARCLPIIQAIAQGANRQLHLQRGVERSLTLSIASL